MTLTRHTQVENLANLLALHRRQAIRRSHRDQGYRRLVAAILDVPVERLDMPRLRTRLSRPVRPLLLQRTRAA